MIYLFSKERLSGLTARTIQKWNRKEESPISEKVVSKQLKNIVEYDDHETQFVIRRLNEQ